mgnify:CR=1 FL=1
MKIKKCTICKVEKLLLEFPKNKEMKDGYRNECKNVLNPIKNNIIKIIKKK